MRLKSLALPAIIGLYLLMGAATLAQRPPVTPVVPPVTTPTETPIPEDARLGVCTGPTLPGFEPYIIREGDRLADLLRGIPNASVTQIAALNCIDYPEEPPVGAVIWLPQRPLLDATPEANGDSAEIIRFNASAEAVQNQAAVDLIWEATGSKAYFYPCPAAAEERCERPLHAQALPVAFTVEGIGGFRYPGTLRYRLEVHGGDGVVTEDVEIEVTCSQQSLLPDGDGPCPQNPPQTVFGAWQPFQNGVMMWFFDLGEIWVMVNDTHEIIILPDTYEEGALELDETAPEDFYVPIRGFGQAWDRLGRAEGLMGWGIAESEGFDSARQEASANSFTTYIQGPGEIVYAVTIIPQLDAAYWTQVAG